MVLSSLYSARIEERFLSLATDLLLEMTSQSPDYTRNMFEFPLSECKFLVRFLFYFIYPLAENLGYLISFFLVHFFVLLFSPHILVSPGLHY